MDERQSTGDLERIRWIGVLLPVAFVWAFELLRFAVLDQAYPRDTVHVLGGLLMAGAVVVFAAAMSGFFGRAQRQIVSQNRDLTVTHAVRTATRESLSLPETLDETLRRLVAATGSLAGVVRIDGAGGRPVNLRQPHVLDAGLDWVTSLLDEPVDPWPIETTYSQRRSIDTGILDIPLARAGQRLGYVRLVSHPPTPPAVSPGALADIAGEIATAVQLSRLVGDLQRRERERAALYEVALQLTGRADVREVLDTITRHARALLSADRAIVCLASPGTIGVATPGLTERLALSDDGTTCLFAHPAAAPDHSRSPLCPLLPDNPGGAVVARPLRGPDGLLGELCVVREAGPEFVAAERTLLGALADMAAIAVRTARLHEAEQQWTILSERDRIARELHDSLAQVLGVIQLRLRAVEPLVAPAGVPGLAEELSEVADIADEAYRDVREAILGLRETISSETGLEGALRDYLRKYTRQTGVRASLVCHGDTRRALDPRSEVQLLRVVQEALTNVRKHAGAKQVVVTLDCASPAPVLTVADDGVGFDPGRVVESLDRGFGMTSMRERVDQIGGTLDVHTEPGQGTRIVVRLSVEEARVAPATTSSRPARR